MSSYSICGIDKKWLPDPLVNVCVAKSGVFDASFLRGKMSQCYVIVCNGLVHDARGPGIASTDENHCQVHCLWMCVIYSRGSEFSKRKPYFLNFETSLFLSLISNKAGVWSKNIQVKAKIGQTPHAKHYFVSGVFDHVRVSRLAYKSHLITSLKSFTRNRPARRGKGRVCHEVWQVRGKTAAANFARADDDNYCARVEVKNNYVEKVMLG